MFASAEKNTRQDNDCVIKTEAVVKSFPPKLRAVLKFSQRSLWCLSSVYAFGKETQQLSYVKAADTSKSLRQQDEAKLLKYRNQKKINNKSHCTEMKLSKKGRS